MTSRRDILAAGVPAVFAGGALASLISAAQQGRISQPPPAGPNQPAAANQNKIASVMGQMWNGTEHTLPPLPYDYNALEPHIDEQTMRIHHGKHHQAYVDGLNKAVADLKATAGQEAIDDARLYGLQRNLGFHYGGYVMHSIFWATMGPASGNGNNSPAGGALLGAINAAYGSFENFQRIFKATATGVKGSGWAVLVYDAVGDRVHVKAMNDQDAYFPPGSMPILPLDVWEHAYYLKYQNNRGAYVDAWWNVVDWATTDALYRMVQAMMQGPQG
jgi:Fe-Mn family superoxide dismutase